MLASVIRGQTAGNSVMIGHEIVAFVSGVIAGAITARMAPSRRLSHATALALTIVSATALATVIARPPAHGPFPSWYPFALALVQRRGRIYRRCTRKHICPGARGRLNLHWSSNVTNAAKYDGR